MALHPRSGATHHAAVQLSRNAHSAAMEAVPADLDASRRIVRREPGRVNAQRGLSMSGDEDPGTARRSVGGCYPPMREPEGSHAADAENFFTKLARSTYPQVRGGHDEGSSDGSTSTVDYATPLFTACRSAGHHEASALESGEWLMSTFRCAANVAARSWISQTQVPGKPGSRTSSGSAWSAAATLDDASLAEICLCHPPAQRREGTLPSRRHLRRRVLRTIRISSPENRRRVFHRISRTTFCADRIWLTGNPSPGS